jgi:hypothetical protein
MIDATYLVQNTETGRVFYATEAMRERATIRRLSEDESKAYLEKVAKEEEAREAAKPKPPDTTQAMGLLRELLQGMTAEAVLQLAHGMTPNPDKAQALTDGADPGGKRGRPKKAESGGEQSPVTPPPPDGTGSDAGSSGVGTNPS